ncbi:hypothetical protein QAD02_008968 [Eretmocerus hayati]|uniref:Uncharacterized protein n=1 Tax=Eretmocerus hayati TaxID=131215 RepID=A0ACC2N8T0_9HYME|nr:hypothetical protein QAD02_008968 [Eretmocerus hayati]
MSMMLSISSHQPSADQFRTLGQGKMKDEIATVRKFQMVWTIESFATLIKTTKQNKLQSPLYSLNVFGECRILLFQDDIMSHLRVLSGCRRKASVSFWINNSRGQLCRIFPCSLVPDAKDVDGDGFGSEFSILTDTLLEQPSKDPNGTLAIKCEVYIFLQNNDIRLERKYMEISDNSHRLKVLDKYENLLGSEKFSDIKFKVMGQDLYGHKNIIANQSPVFSAMFDHEMRENSQNVVKIDDISHEVLLELFRFIYCGKIKDIKNHAEALLIASEKYMIEELKTLCEKDLCGRLSIENVVERLNFATLHNASVLKTNCISFITLHAEKIVELPNSNIHQLDPNIIQDVFKSLLKKRKAAF